MLHSALRLTRVLCYSDTEEVMHLWQGGEALELMSSSPKLSVCSTACLTIKLMWSYCCL